MSKILFETNHGNFTLTLNAEKAPATCENFLNYVQSGFYDGVTFHRVIPNFVIQGGGFTPGMQKKETNPPIQNEADNGLLNSRGTLSMARTSDPHSASSQFFINLSDNAFLDHKRPTGDGWGYCVFAEIIEGLETIDAIAAQPTGTLGGHGDVPLEDCIITKASVIEG